MLTLSQFADQSQKNREAVDLFRAFAHFRNITQITQIELEDLDDWAGYLTNVACLSKKRALRVIMTFSEFLFQPYPRHLLN